MTYEINLSQATQQLDRELAKLREAQLKADYRALLTGGMPSGIRITETNNGHRGSAPDSSTYRPQSTTGLLATDYALDDYNTWK